MDIVRIESYLNTFCEFHKTFHMTVLSEYLRFMEFAKSEMAICIPFEISCKWSSVLHTHLHQWKSFFFLKYTRKCDPMWDRNQMKDQENEHVRGSKKRTNIKQKTKKKKKKEIEDARFGRNWGHGRRWNYDFSCQLRDYFCRFRNQRLIFMWCFSKTV